MINLFMHQISLWLVLIVTAGLAACGRSAPPFNTPTATQPIQITEHPPAENAVATPSTVSVTETAVEQTIEPISGLLMARQNAGGGWGLWVVEEDGRLRRLVEEIAPPTYLPKFDISSDGTQVLYAYKDDIWLLDVISGENQNVTQTPERSERVPRWLPNDVGAFVCGSDSGLLEGPDLGYLTRVGFDGTYEVLDDTGMIVAPPALSPDGQRIAYGHYSPGGSVPAIYRVGEGKEAFSLSDYGVTWAEKMGEASWSPDGQRLAWTLLGTSEEAEEARLGVFNLEQKSYQVVHRYTPARIGDLPPAPLWGPGGEWLVFYALADDPEAQGLWLADLQGETRQLLRLGLSSLTRVQDPALSPDGRWIAFTTPQGDAVGLMEVGEWEPLMWRSPEKVNAVGWVKLGEM